MIDLKPGMNLFMKIGDLAVWNIINPPRQPTLFLCESPEQAKVLIDRLAAKQLKNELIVANAFGLIEWDGEEWTEWYSEEGEDIDEWEPA